MILQRWHNIPRDNAASWTFAIDVGISTEIRMVSQTNTSSKELALICLSLCVVEIVSRIVSAFLAKRQIKSMLLKKDTMKSKFTRRKSRVEAEATGRRNSSAEEFETQKLNLLEALLELHGNDMAANMLAEHLSMWMVTMHLLMAYAFPFNIKGPSNTTPAKIVADFFIQLFFELVADTVSLWVSFRVAALTPMNVFQVNKQWELWGCFFGTALFVASYSFSTHYRCSACSLWEDDECAFIEL